MKFDKIDSTILDLLQSNGRITNARLAEEAHISPPGMLERVRKLENSGVIEKYVALLNPKLVGRGLFAFVSVSLAVHQLDSVEDFTGVIQEMDEVMECYHITGQDDFLLKVAVANMSEYEDFVLHKLSKIAGVSKVTTSMVLSTVKRNTKININTNGGKPHEQRG